MPKISVIIPTRKRNHLLPRALRSLYSQTFSDFEVILIDDNPPESVVTSDPKLYPLLEDKRLRILKNPYPKNASAARNVGLRVAAGEWITYLDDDDEYLPSKLMSQLEAARRTSFPVGLCAVTYHLRGRQRTRKVPENARSGKEILFAFHALPALFHKRASCVLFNEDFDAGEDAYYFFDLLNHYKVDQIFYVDDSLINVYPQLGSHVNTNAEGGWKASLAIYNDFGPAYGEAQRHLFLARARLQYFKVAQGNPREIFELCLRLLKLNGLKETRLILNTLLYKISWLRPFLVA